MYQGKSGTYSVDRCYACIIVSACGDLPGVLTY